LKAFFTFFYAQRESFYLRKERKDWVDRSLVGKVHFSDGKRDGK